jgi:hypothetical protein
VTGKKSITFETKCYENDWEYLLKTDRVRRMKEACRYPFDRAVFAVNNVKNPEVVARYAEKLVLSGVIDAYVHVSDHAEEALRFFGCTPDDFKGGYYYSIAELVGIYLCQTDYLLHFSSDSIMVNGEEWIGSAMERMEEDRSIIVANPTWNDKFHRAAEQSIAGDDRFYKGRGFSDQCYLIPVASFRRPIYRERNPVSESMFPEHGGDSFEKRVDAYMRNHGCLRITSKRASYRHRNFPRTRLKKWLKTTLFSGGPVSA